MPLYFDHIIHYVNGIASIDFPNHHIKSIQGGKHTELGTYNQLSYIDLHYIEWIDVFDQPLAQSYAQTEEGRLSFANTFKVRDVCEGFKRICLRTNDIHKVKEHLMQFELDVVGPIEMSRTKPDGTVINWQLLYLDDDSDLDLPFIIQWGESDEERKSALKAYFHHDLSIEGVTVQVKNIKKTSENWQSWYGLVVLEEDEQYVNLGFTDDNVVITLEKNNDEQYTTLSLNSSHIKKETRTFYKGAYYLFKPNLHKH